MNLISIENLSKTVNETPLFKNVTMGIDEGEKIGFIGPNGSGKSTFLHILSGLTEPDDGNISRNKKVRISMLEQTPDIPEGITVKEFLYKTDSPITRLIQRYHSCLDDYIHSKTAGASLEKLSDQMDMENAWEVENNYLSFLSELKLDNPDQVMDELSGGMKKKAALARALSFSPNILILDEPTNHLDIDIIEWLEKYLSSAGFSYIMVTHDRYFLDSICSTILELDGENILKYPGNYSTFLERKEQRLASEQAQQSRIKSILRREQEWLKRGPRARATKDKKRKMRIQNLMDKQIQNEIEGSDFSSSHRRLGKKILDVKNICKSYGGIPVISPFSYKFKKGERIGLIGPNGSGKTTFLNLITEQIRSDSGEIEKGLNTVFGYYDQLSDHLMSAISRNMTVIEYIEETAQQISLGDGKNVSAARFLEMFNFPSRTHRVSLSHLSGGEKRRLYLIRILTTNPNFLVLDEPTNDLDIDTMTRLEDYIETFTGSALIVSHDRAFLDRTTDYLFIIDKTGGVRGFSGNYSEYRDFIKGDGMESISPGKNSTPGKTKGKTGDKENLHKETGLSYKEKMEFSALELEIEELETEKTELEDLFVAGTLEKQDIVINTSRYNKVLKLIEDKMGRWENLAERSD